MKKILGLVVLSLFAINASAADLLASSAAPTVTQNIVVEGAACPGVGATGFSSTGLLLSCQSGVWSQQFGGFDFVELNVTSVNPGAGAVNLGMHRLCSIAGIGGERPHGYVYRTSTTPDASGKYPFQASWDGYSATMDLRVTCIN